MPESQFTKPPSNSEVRDIADIELPKEKLTQAAAILGGAVNGETEESSEQKKTPKETEVDPRDRQTYVRSLLSQEPWKKTYNLFGDVVKVTFQTRTVQQNQKIREQAVELDEKDRRRHSELYSLIQSLVIIETESKGSIIGGQLIKDGKYDISIFGTMNDILYYALLAAFRNFEGSCDTLFKHANDPDFWNRTDGATSRSEHSSGALSPSGQKSDKMTDGSCASN